MNENSPQEVTANNKKMRKRSASRSLYPIIGGLTLFVLLVLGGLGFRVWNHYQLVLMNNQKDQMQLTTRTLTDSMEIFMDDYLDDLNLMAALEVNPGTDEPQLLEYYREYLNIHNRYVYDIRLEKKDGTMLRSIKKESMGDFVFISQVYEDTTIYQCSGEQGFYMGLQKKIGDDLYITLVLDSQEYYESLIQDIQIGSNGYFVIKNADGLLIMHPSYQQWGIDVIQGRKVLFPDADFESLEDMVDKQIAEDSGIYEYTSYWWTDESVPQVKKIAAHNHCKIGDSFWIVSAVVDYSDLYEPIKAGFREILFVFLGVLIVVLFMVGVVGYLLLTNIKTKEEVTYLKELNATLEELRKSEETLAHQQRLQVVGAMTSGIVHEFNNFLTPIVGYADLLTLEVEEDSEAYEYVTEISEAAEKARELIRQIATMSRKNVETVYRKISATYMMKRAMKMILTVCPANVHLEEESRLTDEEILGNITQIHQILLNICVNGIHAIGHQEGLLHILSESVSREKASEIASAEQISDQWSRYLHISITDSGCGMDSNTMEHIFEPFFTTKKAGEGTGLGLSMADQIVRYHRGCISVESSLGQGSVFHILLPIIESGDEKAEIDWTKENRITILIVDDNQKILEMLEKDFGKMGVEVKTCTRCEEANDILADNSVSILAIDETIADGYGIDYCMSISGKYPEMLRILMTDRMTREVVDAKRREIIHNYVKKPLSAQELIRVVRETGR